MRKKNVVIMLFVFAGIIVIVYMGVLIPLADSEAGPVCTAEAKLCPDGSYVGRVSAHCEFAPCPGKDLPAESAPGDFGFEQEVAASGIAGDVVLGPLCPVIGPGMEEQCADKGYQTTLVVEAKDGGQEVARVQSGVDGRFRVVLAPGEYIVAPLSGARPLPNCEMQFVTVEPGQFAPMMIHCDTGMR